jgi:hypothetical protein
MLTLLVLHVFQPLDDVICPEEKAVVYFFAAHGDIASLQIFNAILRAVGRKPS